MNDAVTDEHFARCPHCDAVFRVGEHKLVQREGAVRCGACREVFNAYDYQVYRDMQGLFADSLAQQSGDALQDGNDASPESDTPVKLVPIRELLRRNLAAIETERQTGVPSSVLKPTPLQQHESDDPVGSDHKSISNTTGAENLDAPPSLGRGSELSEAETRATTSAQQAPEFSQSGAAAGVVHETRKAPEIGGGQPAAASTSAPAGPTEVEPDPRRWFNADPDPQLDNNPFADRSKPGEKMEGATTSAQFNMQGVDEFIMDRPNPLVNVFWGMVALGFVILLGLQVKLFFVDRFAQNEDYRPYLGLFCKIASCELPPRRDAYRFTITNTRIDLHPAEPGALRITVKLLNQATFSQPFPELQLTLTDRVGRVVGRRSFDPEFYLENGRRNQLNSGELGSVVFDLAHPHEKAVGFVVDIVRTPVAS